jgi:hypothetical protein
MVSIIGKSAFLMLLPAILCMLPGSSRATEEPTPPLVLERTIPLAGVSGRIDHMGIDLRRKHLFVAELGNGTLDVIDVATGQAVHRIGGLKEPQGVGYAPLADLIAVANAGDGTVQLFGADDFSRSGTIDLGDDADNVRLDAQSGRFVVGYGSGGLVVLDRAARSVVSRTKLPAHPEGFRLESATPRAFVNLPDAHQIAVVDLAIGKQLTAWHVPDLRANFPMALDESGAVLATVFRSPARLVLLDTKSGVVRENLATCGDADDVFFDARRRRIYVSCGEGMVDVLQQEGNGYRRLEQIKTAVGARTSLFVPELDRLFVAARAGFFGSGSDAAILVFRPVP